MKLKSEKKKPFEIIGLLEDKDILWKNIKCVCGTTIDKKYPLSECMHCKFQEQEDSLPKQKFRADNKEVNQITIVRGVKFKEVIGWTWSN